MARQLEARLEDLRRERARLQEAIRRVGESFARGLDRHGVLEIVVQTAVDGVGAACRPGHDAPGATRRSRRSPAPASPTPTSARCTPPSWRRWTPARWRRSRSAARQRARRAARAPPRAASRELAIVSVARGDRSFSPQERELFSYLTSQAAVSVENVDLHETVQRQAVTDELTGLFNHRRFQEVMSAEVERARRYDQEMGLIMLDIDNFKRVNDTYGHVQGDMVLREVARVPAAVRPRRRRARPLRRRGDGGGAAADRPGRRVPVRRARPAADRGARAAAAGRRRQRSR